MSLKRSPSAQVLVIERDLSDAAQTHVAPETAGSCGDDSHVGRQFCAVARAQGMAPAISTATETFSYGQLLNGARAVARELLRQSAFAAGDCVVLLLPNSVEYVAAFYGVLLAGGVVAPLPAKIESNALGDIIEATECARLITTSAVMRSRADLMSLPRDSMRLFTNSPVNCEAAEIESEPCKSSAGTRTAPGAELAAIFFTAGSTGSPKGVMLSHGNLLANARSIQQYLHITANDRPLCVLPFQHAFGNSVLQSHILAGAHLVLDGQTMFPETLVDAIRTHACTSFSAVPDLFRMLLDHSSLGQADLPALQYMAVAGGALRRENALDVIRRIAPADFFVMYGQTEATARLAYIPPRMFAELPEGCIGRSVPDVTLEIVDEQGIRVPAGEIGELRACGPNVMLGYWKDPAATEKCIRDGWLYTGDLAAMDAAGWISLKGRRNALVKIAGFRVHPAELEEFAVRRLPVSQAVSVAYEAPAVGMRLALYVKATAAAGPLAVSEMVARCRAELPRQLVPDLVQIVAEFPLNHALKIDRPLLSRLAAESAVSRRALASNRILSFLPQAKP